MESAYKPYSPQVDKLSPLGNNSPDPWQVHSEPSLSFQDETKKIAFANTDVIKASLYSFFLFPSLILILNRNASCAKAKRF